MVFLSALRRVLFNCLCRLLGNMQRWWALNITSTLWIFIKGCVISAGNVCATLRITRCLTRTFHWPTSAAIFGINSSVLLYDTWILLMETFLKWEISKKNATSLLFDKKKKKSLVLQVDILLCNRTFAGGSRWMEQLRCLGQPWWRALMGQGEAERRSWVSNSHGSGVRGY